MEFVCLALRLYFFVLLARVILSWIQVAGARLPEGLLPVYKVIHDLTEPFLAPFRRIIPPVGMLDVSFLVAVILLQVINRIICSGF